MSADFAAALGYPAGPLAEPATFWRAPRFPLLHADPECPALRNWRTGCWPGTDDRAAEVPAEVQVPVAAVVTGQELGCPCTLPLPDLLDIYRQAGLLLAAAARQLTELAEPTVDRVLTGMLLTAELDDTLTTAPADDLGDLADLLADVRAKLAAALTAAQLQLAYCPSRRRELLVAEATDTLGPSWGYTIAQAADRSTTRPGTRPGAGVSSAPLAAVRTAWADTYATTGDLAAAAAAAAADPAAHRVVVDAARGGSPPLPAASRTHVRHAVTVWETALAAAAAVPVDAGRELVAFPDWETAVLNVAGNPAAHAAIRELFARNPVHRIGAVAVVAAEQLELAAFWRQLGHGKPALVRFGVAPDTVDWRDAVTLAWQLWTDAGGRPVLSSTGDWGSQSSRSGTLADPYAAFGVAVGILTGTDPAPGS